MTQSSARRVALAALKTWRTKNDFADRVISRLLEGSSLNPPDRAFAVELFYGVLRNLTLLDFWIAALRPQRLNIDLRDVVRLGLDQLFITKTSQHAAVYETVELVPNRQRPVINGILRAAVRKQTELREGRESQPLDVRFSHPKFLIDRWTRHFGPDSSYALCEWNNQPPPIYARINQLKIDRQDFLEHYREARSIPSVANFVELPAPSAALNRGDCYVQDPSTAIACELLKPNRGEKVLDACAAPGGKTSYLAELMGNQGVIVTCDRDPNRLELLQQNLVRIGITIAQIVQHDWATDQLPNIIEAQAPFDRILIDAPCSNTGVMRRRVDVRWRLRTGDFVQMQTRQIAIARAVLPLLKPDGILVYSTCSLEPEENEQVVQGLLREVPKLKLEDERKCLPFTDHFDGAFAARFRRTD